MKTELELIAESYLAAKTQPFSSNAVGEFIRAEAPNAVRVALHEDADGLIFKGSAGMSRWADSPWIAVMDPLVTDTAQRGFYVVYLYSTTMQSIVLSLQLGITEYRTALSTDEAKSRLKHTAELMRLTVPEFCSAPYSFSADPISLNPLSPSSRTAYYQAGHVLGKTYTLPLPDDTVLAEELRLAVKVYRLLSFRATVGTATAEEGRTDDPGGPDAEGIEEHRKYRLHHRIERDRRTAKRVKSLLGYRCQACGFSFSEVYGRLGEDYIEAHHLIPISSLPPDRPVKRNPAVDFAVLCSNCHRMIHASKLPSDVQGLKSAISESTCGARLKALFANDKKQESAGSVGSRASHLKDG